MRYYFQHLHLWSSLVFKILRHPFFQGGEAQQLWMLYIHHEKLHRSTFLTSCPNHGVVSFLITLPFPSLVPAMPYQKRTLWRVGERWISNVILHISREKKWQSLFNPWLITKSTMMASCFGNPTLFSLPFPLLMWSLRFKLHHGNHESTTKVHQNTAARNLPNLPWIFHYLLKSR